MKEKPPKNLRAFRVFAIKEGTVIDHITAGQALTIVRLLNLAAEKKVVSIGLNFPSKDLGLKDIIKVEKRELKQEEADLLSVFAPQATINLIGNYKVVKKMKAKIPETIKHVIVCPNLNCITNQDETDSVFKVSSDGKDLKLSCHYCERTFKQSDIREYKTN